MLVEYSVHLPISQPATRPTITLIATPKLPCRQPRSTGARRNVAAMIAPVDMLIPRARAANRLFCDESSLVRTW